MRRLKGQNAFHCSVHPLPHLRLRHWFAGVTALPAREVKRRVGSPWNRLVGFLPNLSPLGDIPGDAILSDARQQGGDGRRSAELLLCSVILPTFEQSRSSALRPYSLEVTFGTI